MSRFLAILIILIAAVAHAEFDLTRQFPDVGKIQQTNTCYLHTGISLIEAAAYRFSKEQKQTVWLDDEVISTAFLERLLAKGSYYPSKKWVDTQKSYVGLAIFFYSRGKLKSPLDFGALDSGLIYFLLRTPLYKKSADLDGLVGAYWEDLGQELSRRSTEMMLNPPPKHPTLMTPEELFSWPLMAQALDATYVSVRHFREQTSAQTEPYIVPDARFVADDLKVDSDNLGRKGEVLRMNLYEATKPYSKYAEKPPTSKDKQHLIEARHKCSDGAPKIKKTLINMLSKNLPVGVGLFPGGIDFSKTSNPDDFSKVYFKNDHAMTLVGLKNYKNEWGDSEEYFLFRDSGFFKGSRYARMPVSETCRVFNAVVLRTLDER